MDDSSKTNHSSKGTIDSFRGDFFYLSNFSNYPITYEGITYKNNEAAFQAAKLATNTTIDSKTKLTRQNFSDMTGRQAKEAGKRVSLRSDWENIKLQVMKDICKAKFTQNKSLKEKLIQTGNAPIIENNSWGDTFWGVSNKDGENHLGKILMEIRSELDTEPGDEKKYQEKEQEPLDNSRLGKSKRKLVRLQNELNEQIEKMFEHQRKTNGQPMNDKRNGHSFFKKQELLENKVHSLREEIKQQEKQVEKLERQEELKEMGYNKYGGLDITIENIPRIKEEIGRFEKGESTFSAATIRKYQRKLETLEQLKEKSEKGKTNILPEVQAIIDSGRVTQWKKNPTIYFLKGYRKVALELNENGEFQVSKRYPAKNEKEKELVNELVSAKSSVSDEFERYLTEINHQAFNIILNKKGYLFSDKDVEKMSNILFDLENKHWENIEDKRIMRDFSIVKAVRQNIITANEVLNKSGQNDAYRHVYKFEDNYEEVMIEEKLISNELSKEQKEVLMNQGQEVSKEYNVPYGFVENINEYSDFLIDHMQRKNERNKHFYRVEFNENDPGKGLKSYGGEIVTLELIDQLKTLDNQYAGGTGYYKFYFEEVKNGEVVDQIRMDLGDGVNSNQPVYLELAKLCDQVPEKEQKQAVKNEPDLKNQVKDKETKKKQKGYQKRTTEDIKQEVKLLSQQALDAVKKHTHSPEDVKELLNFMSRFPERSFRNQVLIEAQFPGASACLGRAALKKEGIYIKQGEQGNKIFVRKTVKGFYDKGRGFVRETEATPEDKKRIESGQIEVIKKPYYTIEKVFDITQTQLKPEDYPKIFPNRVFDFQLDKKGQSELQAGIQAVANTIGIQIRDMTESEVYPRELGQARGAYVHNEFTGQEEIVMNTRNTPTQHLATSIHELAHARMHKFSELDTETKELQAEMTSYIICKHFGMDTSEKAIPYIATWTKNGQTLDDKEATERGKIMNDVSRVANEFIQTISKEINQYRERDPEIQQAEVKQDHKDPVEMVEQKNVVPVGSLWIDKKDGKVMEEDTGRTLQLKDAAFIEDSQHNQVILKGKSYGKEIQTALPSDEFALGNPFHFSQETVSEVAKRKNEIYHEQQMTQKERV
nr:NADAR domain-containing protein [Enterococcus mundtii]